MTAKSFNVAWIGLGSNQGNRHQWIQKALELLEKSEFIRILKTSSLIKTLPQDAPCQEFFLNGVAKIESTLSPQELLLYLQHVEKKLGRKRTIPNGARNIDLDLLFVEQEIMETTFLTLPHPRITERYFVLKPLVEMDQSWIHPTYQLPLQEIWERFLKNSVQGGEGWPVISPSF